MSTIELMQVRSIRAVIAALFLVVVIPFVRAERVQDLPQPTNYVSDFAGVLSPALQAALSIRRAAQAYDPKSSSNSPGGLACALVCCAEPVSTNHFHRIGSLRCAG